MRRNALKIIGTFVLIVGVLFAGEYAFAGEKPCNPIETVRVGSSAYDFDLPAYYQGGFTNVKLSDFSEKWVMLCFYPGDFTFV